MRVKPCFQNSYANFRNHIGKINIIIPKVGGNSKVVTRTEEWIDGKLFIVITVRLNSLAIINHETNESKNIIKMDLLLDARRICF